MTRTRNRGAALVLGVLLLGMLSSRAGAQSGRPINPRALPRGHGWFCSSWTADDGATRTRCDRTQRECEHARGEQLDMGEEASACTLAQVAQCFTYVLPNGRSAFQCRGEQETCEASRQILFEVNHVRERIVVRNISECAEVQ